MNELVNDFLDFLDEEFQYLTKIKLFLLGIPELIANLEVEQVEFQNFLEKYEIQNARFIHGKKQLQQKIAEKMNAAPEQVTFRLLAQLGYRDFEEKGHRVLKVSNEIAMLLLKISIYLRNFSKLQQEFKQLNHFLYQNDYSPRGVAVESPYNPGRNFYGEA